MIDKKNSFTSVKSSLERMVHVDLNLIQCMDVLHLHQTHEPLETIIFYVACIQLLRFVN